MNTINIARGQAIEQEDTRKRLMIYNDYTKGTDIYELMRTYKMSKYMIQKAVREARKELATGQLHQLTSALQQGSAGRSCRRTGCLPDVYHSASYKFCPCCGRRLALLDGTPV